jgi:hypothetical protein
LDGIALTKAEKEYFCGVVKKKVVALADAQLHRLAQQLPEYRELKYTLRCRSRMRIS